MILATDKANRRFWDTPHEWWNPWRFGLLLTLLILAAFPDVVLGFKTFVFRDYALFGYPLASYHREAFWRGEIPLWNPLNNCGLPFLAQWNTMVLYPLSLFYLLFPLPWSLGIFCLLHLFLAGLGMYFLARHWTRHPLAATLAGVAFAFNGLTLGCLIWPNNIAALGWMPWVILLVESAWQLGGRRIVAAALAGAVQMLAGAPEITLFTWLLLVGLWVGSWVSRTTPRWVMAGRAAGVVLLVTGLCAAQLIPLFELLRHSQRHSSYGGTLWSLPPGGWANLLVPLFHCRRTSVGVFMQDNQGWTSSYYLGIGVLALALLALWRVRNWRVWFLGLALLVSLILALGNDGYLYGGLGQLLPLGFVRYPVKFMVLAAWVVPLLAAFAVRHVLEARTEAHPSLGREVMWLATALIVLVGGILCFSYHYPGREEQWSVTLVNGLTRALVLVLTLAMPFAAAKVSRAGPRWVLQVAFVLLVWLDTMTHTPRQNPGVVPEAYALKLPPLLEMQPRPQHGESRAMLSRKALEKFHSTIVSNTFEAALGLRLGLYDNCNLLEGLPKLDGFYSLYFPEEEELRFRLLASARAHDLPLTDFLGVSQVVSEDFRWRTRSSWMPLVTAGQQARFADRAQVMEALLHPDFNPRRTVFLPPEARATVSATNPTLARIGSTRASSHRVEAVIDSRQPTFVVVAQAFYPPWKARVDGQPARLWRANGAFQAVEVPAGQHEVTLTYEDRGFAVGGSVSAASLVLCGVAWRWRRRMISDSQRWPKSPVPSDDAVEERDAA